jgi:hypothetical protein
MVTVYGCLSMSKKTYSNHGREGKAMPVAQRSWPFFTHALAWPTPNHAENPRQGFPFPPYNEVCYFWFIEIIQLPFNEQS